MLGATRWRPHPLLGAKRSFPLEFSRATWCLLEPGGQRRLLPEGHPGTFQNSGTYDPWDGGKTSKMKGGPGGLNVCVCKTVPSLAVPEPGFVRKILVLHHRSQSSYISHPCHFAHLSILHRGPGAAAGGGGGRPGGQGGSRGALYPQLSLGMRLRSLVARGAHSGKLPCPRLSS